MNGFEKVKEKKKRAIKDAALLLFSERGFNEVKIEDIAKEAKVSQVTIYNHFGSKDALFRELIQEFTITEFQFYQEIAAENMPFQDMMHKMILRKMKRGSLFHPEMLLQATQKDPELREFLYRYQSEIVIPWFFEILEDAQRKNEINPHLSKEMMLLYINMFNKLGEEHGIQLLEGNREEHIKDIVTMFFMDYPILKARLPLIRSTTRTDSMLIKGECYMPLSCFYYEVVCMCCRKMFRVYEGTQKYKQFKENMKGKYTCEECSHNIRIEAIMNFFNKY